MTHKIYTTVKANLHSTDKERHIIISKMVLTHVTNKLSLTLEAKHESHVYKTLKGTK